VPKPTPFEVDQLLQRDKLLRAPLSLYGPFPGFPTSKSAKETDFQSLAKAIVSQQLSSSAANTIYLNLHSAVTVLAPKHINDLPLSALRAVGLSSSKAHTLKELSLRIMQDKISLSLLRNKPDLDVISELVAIKGIGPWTAQMFLLFKLGRLDVLPVNDLGVQEGLRILDCMSSRPTAAEVALRGALWSPLKSLGTWLMWQIANANKNNN
jgi:DNA-3-methyladenine glycosylase II